jgi:hypothetical protein
MTESMARVNSIVIADQPVHNSTMKRFAVIGIIAAIGLIGCAPLNTYYKTGASVAKLQRDTTACEVKALRDVPASTQVRRIPPEYVPPVKKCDADGQNCVVVRGGYFIPGEIITFDPNDGLRSRVEGQCMADKGYEPVSISPCPDSVARATLPAATKRLPPLTPKSCEIRNTDGSFQTVTRG